MFEFRTFDLIVPTDEADLVIYEFDRPTVENLDNFDFMTLSYCAGPHGPVTHQPLSLAS